MANYTQCTLTKVSKDGVRTQTAWLPAQFAKSKYVKIKENGVWEDGWKVESHGGSITEDALGLQNKTQRKMNDVLSDCC